MVGTQESREIAPGFEAIADAIMYRWSTERDIWVSSGELEQARAYLARAGVVSTRFDGRLLVEGEPTGTLEAARLVLLGLRHLHATRRGRPD